MPQSLHQEQISTLQTLQQISQQQLLVKNLLEMPLVQFEERVNNELNENGALEENIPDDNLLEPVSDYDNEPSDSGSETFEQQNEREERQEQLDQALQTMGMDDQMEPPSQRSNEDYTEPIFGNAKSFYDLLKEQMGELNLNDKQRDIMEYLIGSLDETGKLSTPLQDIVEDLFIYHYIDTDTHEVEEMVHLLQTFDPPGIGARDLQECLLLQIQRKKDSDIKTQMLDVVTNHFDELQKNHWNKIQTALHLDEDGRNLLQQEIRKLNPKPGASLGETVGKSQQQITPDFIIETDDNGHVTFEINNGRIPDMHVAPSFVETIEFYKDKKQLNKREKDELAYTKERVDRAKNFIEAIKQRRLTLYKTMKTIIDIQKRYFQEGDEAVLKPMKLKDISELTELDISTVSRVCNQKYAQTRWGIFPLRHFFSDSYIAEDGTELSTRNVKDALKRIIDEEDKSHPLSDEALTKKMKEAGYAISRRTVNKYRDQLEIPKASLRKQ